MTAFSQIAASLRKLCKAFAALEADFYQEGGLGQAAGIVRGSKTGLTAAKETAKKLADMADAYATVAHDESERVP